MSPAPIIKTNGAVVLDRRRRLRSVFLGVPELSEPLGPRRKLRLAGEVYVAYCHVRWWLRRHEIGEVLRRLRGWGPVDVGVASCEGDDVRQIHLSGLRLGRAVIHSLHLLPTDSRCLMRSLVLTGLLARRGIASSLIIGVRPEPEFSAHAWVEHAGEPLLPPGDPDLGRLTEL
ncbi:MAG: lasso peptide biosynthesis B2 protein [Chloroflexota bacterium]|nr:lasso peptide biosynthesis B2 protein [Chloroflexota bacterium]